VTKFRFRYFEALQQKYNTLLGSLLLSPQGIYCFSIHKTGLVPVLSRTCFPKTNLFSFNFFHFKILRHKCRWQWNIEASGTGVFHGRSRRCMEFVWSARNFSIRIRIFYMPDTFYLFDFTRFARNTSKLSFNPYILSIRHSAY
jgi:hypothetical protein